MEAHEYCLMFPNMSPEEFAELSRDIAKNGLLDPIVTYQGMILDGRHRHKACGLLAVVPKYEEWNGQGGSILAFVISRNLHRRSLSPSQRAAIALDVKDRLNEEYEAKRNAGKRIAAAASGEPFTNNGKRSNAQHEAAAMMNVSHGYVSDAQRIRDKSPNAFEEVKRGEKTIPQAKRELAEKSKPANEDPSLFDSIDLKPDPLTEFSEKFIADLNAAKKHLKKFDLKNTDDVVSRIDSLILAVKVLMV